MSYFNVPLGVGNKLGGQCRPIHGLQAVLITEAIDYGKYKIWIASDETRISRRGFSVLRR